MARLQDDVEHLPLDLLLHCAHHLPAERIGLAAAHDARERLHWLVVYTQAEHDHVRHLDTRSAHVTFAPRTIGERDERATRLLARLVVVDARVP